MTTSDPIYGKIEITEPVLLELIATGAMQRLKGIDQNVTANLLPIPWKPFTRFDHCVGVMLLIRKLGGSLEEQIAGLLHDISHTAFSHVMDFVFDQQMTQNFHEEHIERIVKQSAIPEILSRYGFDTDRVINHANFSILEQELPALCADRVDYAVKTFYSGGQDAANLKKFVTDLTVTENQITFRHSQIALEFARQFLATDLAIWGGSAACNIAYHLFSIIIKKAYQNGEVSFDDFFTTDEEVLGKLGPESKKEVEKLRLLKFIEVAPSEPYDYHVNGKIRYVDPPVKTKHGLKKLSEIDENFHSEMKAFLAKRKQGNYVKIIS